jgi:hypothetical protein
MTMLPDGLKGSQTKAICREALLILKGVLQSDPAGDVTANITNKVILQLDIM